MAFKVINKKKFPILEKWQKIPIQQLDFSEINLNLFYIKIFISKMFLTLSIPIISLKILKFFSQNCGLTHKKCYLWSFLGKLGKQIWYFFVVQLLKKQLFNSDTLSIFTYVKV